MSTIASTAGNGAASRGASWARRTQGWLDGHGPMAWIAAMVAGFVLFWPVGLALVFYMTATGRWGRKGCGRTGRMRGAAAAFRSSGNSAFDAYKADTLRRLEEEQGSFEAFLGRLREAKDKAEFDQFMTDRARTARDATPADGGPDGGSGGGTDDGRRDAA